MSAKRVWVVLPDQLSTRLFVDTGILAGLSDRLDDAVAAVLVGDGAGWPEGTGGVPRDRRPRTLVPENASAGRASSIAAWIAGSTGRSATTRSRSG